MKTIEPIEPETESPDIPADPLDLLEQFIRSLPGRNRAQRMQRLRCCVSDTLRRRFLGATESDVWATFHRLTGEGLDATEAAALSEQFAEWWARQRSTIARRNASRDEKEC